MLNKNLKEFLDRFPEIFKVTVNGADFRIKGDFYLDGAELGGVINLVSADAAAAEENIPMKASKISLAGKKMPMKFKNLRDDMLSDIRTGMPRSDFMKKYGASYNTFIRYRAKACGFSNKTVNEKKKHDTGKEGIDGHKSEVKRNRANIKADIMAGLPKEKVIQKYGIGIATYNRRKREAESVTKGIPGNNSSEVGQSDHTAAETVRKKDGSCAGRHMRFVIGNKEKIINDLANGMSKKECMLKWKISERLYGDLKSIAVARSAEEPERTAPLLAVSKSRLERSRSIIEELNRAEDRVYRETGDYNFMLVKKNSNQASSPNP